MGKQAISSVLAVATAIVGLAIIAVLVAKGSQTSTVISTIAQGFGADIQAAVSPVMGSGSALGSSVGLNGSGIQPGSVMPNIGLF